MSRQALPLPSPDQARGMCRGNGRSAVIRYLRGQGCSAPEIATHLHVSPDEVRRTLRRPVNPSYLCAPAPTAYRWQQRGIGGRWVKS